MIDPKVVKVAQDVESFIAAAQRRLRRAPDAEYVKRFKAALVIARFHSCEVLLGAGLPIKAWPGQLRKDVDEDGRHHAQR